MGNLGWTSKRGPVHNCLKNIGSKVSMLVMSSWIWLGQKWGRAEEEEKRGDASQSAWFLKGAKEAAERDGDVFTHFFSISSAANQLLSSSSCCASMPSGI